MEATLRTGETLIVSLALLAGALILGLVGHAVVFRAFHRIARRAKSDLWDTLTTRSRGPSQVVAPLLASELVIPSLHISPRMRPYLEHGLDLTLAAAVTWLVIRWIDVLGGRLIARYGAKATDPVKARKLHTQYQIIRRLVIAAIIVLSASIMLLTFDKVRAIGASVLASAGLAALVAGIAARPTIANLFAGLQIALTEPIDLEDAVVVEGEWGWIEEITFTYIVVRTWDLRRLSCRSPRSPRRPFSPYLGRGGRSVGSSPRSGSQPAGLDAWCGR